MKARNSTVNFRYKKVTITAQASKRVDLNSRSTEPLPSIQFNSCAQMDTQRLGNELAQKFFVHCVRLIFCEQSNRTDRWTQNTFQNHIAKNLFRVPRTSRDFFWLSATCWILGACGLNFQDRLPPKSPDCYSNYYFSEKMRMMQFTQVSWGILFFPNTRLSGNPFS